MQDTTDVRLRFYETCLKVTSQHVKTKLYRRCMLCKNSKLYFTFNGFYRFNYNARYVEVCVKFIKKMLFVHVLLNPRLICLPKRGGWW